MISATSSWVNFDAILFIVYSRNPSSFLIRRISAISDFYVFKNYKHQSYLLSKIYDIFVQICLRCWLEIILIDYLNCSSVNLIIFSKGFSTFLDPIYKSFLLLSTSIAILSYYCFYIEFLTLSNDTSSCWNRDNIFLICSTWSNRY